MWVCVVVAHMFYSIDCVCFLFFVFFSSRAQFIVCSSA